MPKDQHGFIRRFCDQPMDKVVDLPAGKRLMLGQGGGTKG
jgi:hypothetical protein